MRSEEIHGYIRNVKSMTPSLQKRIDEYYRYKWAITGSVENSQLLFTDLHPELKSELIIAECKDIVRKIPLFQDCQPHTVKKLLSNLKKRIYLPGERVVLFGEVAYEMYLIQRGQFNVLNKHGSLVRVLKDGDFFGEVSLRSPACRTT